MKLRNKLIATIVSISMVLAVVGIGAWASVESFTASITNTVNLEFDNIKGQISVIGMSGADNLEEEAPWMEEVLYDGSNVIYNQISSNATNGTNLYWDGTRFLDSSEDGMQVVDNETEAAVVGYLFQYSPTDACTGMSTITAMVTETATPEISGGKLMVKYFAMTDMQACTEIESGAAITPIRDNEMLVVIAVCQYYNLEGESITSVASAWDFNVTFTAGRNEITTLPGGAIIDGDPSDGIVLAYNYTSPGESFGEIIEFGEYPQTLKASDVTITSDTPDEDGYYLGSDGARYAKLTTSEDDYIYNYGEFKMNRAADGTLMNMNGDNYFKVEPIKWRVLSDEGGKTLIVSDKILDRSNRHDSSINFLTEEFYNSAFSVSEQSQILTTDIDNGKMYQWDDGNEQIVDIPNATNNQYKVFRLGVQELTNSDYGFNPNFKARDAARFWQTTDYARALGLWTITREYLEAIGVQVEAAAPYIGTGAMSSRTRAEYIVGGSVDYTATSTGCWIGCIMGSMDVIFEGIAPAMTINRN